MDDKFLRVKYFAGFCELAWSAFMWKALWKRKKN